MNKKYILVAMVLGTSITMSSCTKDKEDNFVYSPVEASKVVSDLGIESTVVTYNLNGGGGSTPMDAIVLKGSSIELPNADAFGRDGYDFDGWATSYNGSPLEKNGDGKQNYTVNGNVVLYATWKARTVKKALDAETVPQTLVIEEKNLTEWEFKQLKTLVLAGVEIIDLSKTEITEIPDETFDFSEYDVVDVPVLEPEPEPGPEPGLEPEPDESDFGGLKKIIFPEKLTKIGKKAFMHCIGIETIDLSKTALEDIGQGAFENAEDLKSLVLNDKVKTIGINAFSGCSSLTSENVFKIPASVTSIGNGAFNGTSFIKIEVGEGVKLVKSKTFAYCSELKEITFNYNGIEKLRINPNAFLECNSLEKISYKANEGVDLPNEDFDQTIGTEVEPTKVN